jgi:hypothetical protein
MTPAKKDPQAAQEARKRAAAILGRQGGTSRAAKLSPTERSRIAKAAIEARWAAWRKAGKPKIRRRRKAQSG